MNKPYEEQYIDNLANILNHGKLEKNERTGIKTWRLPSTQIVVDLEKEFPILQSKKVAWKTAADEILWIMQMQSNDIGYLHSTIWDAWASADGTIGKSYGYQAAKPVNKDGHFYEDQVDYILTTLQRDPSNRQCVINLWNVQELGEMNLVPCCYSSVWNIIDGRLNCMLVQRSADYPVGVPFDTTEYAVLVHMFARHLGVKPGILTHVMADSHIYENQYDGVKKQLEQYEKLAGENRKTPRLNFREDALKDFWQMGLNDIYLEDYDPMPAIKFEVAV